MSERRKAIKDVILSAIKETHFVRFDPDLDADNTAYWLSGHIEAALKRREDEDARK